MRHSAPEEPAFHEVLSSAFMGKNRILNNSDFRWDTLPSVR
jgi:hypothetical protein